MNNCAPTSPSTATAGPVEPVRRLRLRVRGAVQGVGFRPYVYRLATELGLGGWVSNDPRGVSIEVAGPEEAVASFHRRLPAEGPPLAVIHDVTAEWPEPAEPPERSEASPGFRIETSETAGTKTAVVLPDAATCPACLAEVLDPADRRSGYPFTNCTHCGPRFTIVRALPYDRPNTTMARFRMCPRCRREYEDPLDRRFHAQPNACPDCGPRLALLDRRGEVVAGDPVETPVQIPLQSPDQALRAAAGALRDGKILALEGLGGFQLLVDARNPAAVAALRERKQREAKPFAVMVRDLDRVRALCHLPDVAAELLASPRAPIVLLRRRPDRSGATGAGVSVTPGVAPGSPWLGIMLPTTPLHHLLLRELGFPVVATSGNLSDEPIATDERDAVERLGSIADLFLVHDRPIARHADDSVVRLLRGEPRLLRRARGYAPMPLFLPEPLSESPPEPLSEPLAEPVPDPPALPTVLALGAHLKNTVALAVEGRVYVSQHLGDMETPRALAAFDRVIADFLELYEAVPAVVAHDLHPDYASTRAAHRLAAGWEAAGRPVRRIAVQHHHAHLAACLAENGRTGRALGVTWDGTGHGTDGTVWGGELLLGDAASFRRVARLRPFRLPGGDAAVKEPRRVALALLWELLGPGALERDDLAPVRAFTAPERRLLGRLLETGLRSPVTTSAGRLFDGVAALAGLARTVSFEGQAAMALELAAESTGSGGGRVGRGAYPVDLVEAPEAAVDWELDWRPLVAAVLEDLRRGAGPEVIGVRFHGALVAALVAAARRVGEPVVALSGGCFQNRLLTEGAAEALERAGFEVLLHRDVPPNDGGIAFGQVAVATARWMRMEGTDD